MVWFWHVLATFVNSRANSGLLSSESMVLRLGELIFQA